MCLHRPCQRASELDHLFEQFLCDYPNVHFQEKYYPIDEIGAKLLDGTCDFAVLSQQLCSPNINWLPLFVTIFAYCCPGPILWPTGIRSLPSSFPRNGRPREAAASKP